MQTPETIAAFFHEKIPLSRAMGVQVLQWDSEALVLGAPLSQNFNHLGTAFGGSLTALATLCGYGVIWLELGDANAHVVIRKSEMSFRQPVRHDLRAICRRPSREAIAELESDLKRKGKARITLRVDLLDSEALAAIFEGVFVAVG